MSLKSAHPLYVEYLSDWELCRDSLSEKLIKEKGEVYLPPTSAHIMDGYGTPGAVGQAAYDAYKTRAVYPDIFQEAVAAAIGIMHREAPTIELPKKLEVLLQKATRIGEPLELLLRRINAEQLTTGRVGILGDIYVNPKTNKPEPILVLYKEKAIRNWNNANSTDTTDFSLVVLDETKYMLDSDLSWKLKEQYFILALRDGDSFSETGSYQYSFADSDADIRGLVFEQPSIFGNRLDSIPFVAINAKDLNPNPDSPPLLGLAHQCLTIYRGEADYRQSLFMQGQDTLVKIGHGYGDESEPQRVGAGSVINVPMGGDAKYIGVNSQGLPEQRQALENDYKRAQSKAGQVTDATSRAKESGDALRIRVAAQSATLPEIAQAGAAGLQKVLRQLAVWFGEDPEKVVVKPNLNFTNEEFQGQTFLQLTQSKAQGAPVSNETLHAYLRDRGITSLTYEEETGLLQGEVPTV